jgi:exodeoxyribonuclease V alpha subunit
MGECCTIEGIVQSTIFQNEENGYTVLRLVTQEGEVVTVVGCIPCAAPGESMTVTGVWNNHPTYGQQLTAESVERRMPESESDILDYLASGVLRGVGPATAQRLVERFGADTLVVLETEIEKLSTIKGITAKKAMEIGTAFRALTGMRRVMEFLARYDLPVSLAMQLYRTYGDDTIEHLHQNPYLLAEARFGVEFSAADTIAISLGLPGDSHCRLEAALTYELTYNLDAGHVFLPREKLLYATAQLLSASPEALEAALDNLIDRKAIVQEHIAGVDACYLWRMYEAEVFVAQRLRALASQPADQGRGVDKTVAAIEKEQGITYAPLQHQAVALSAKEGVVLLTGGPGTGKTTSVRGIVALFDKMGLDVLLLAPTGRAAKRMSELCGRDAQTIHRALGMKLNDATGEVVFTKDAKDPLEADAVIVDEMSMVDLLLMRALLAAMRPGCRLVMVGDPDQLPSVGAGNVFSDLIRSKIIVTVALNEVFRQASQSAIIRSAHAVNRGDSPDLAEKKSDFFFLTRRSSERLCATVVELCQTRLPDNMNIPSDEIQVLAATRKGPSGTANLNRLLQNALNPPAGDKREKQWGEITFREGDRVMQIKNNYDIIWVRTDGTEGTGVFNGDVGKIEEIDPSGEQMRIRFDDHTAVYPTELLSQLELAYAITVHKAQGSEYRAVILALGPSAPALQVRSVLYTAITRARELLVLVGDDLLPGKMAQNDRPQRRYSGLRRRLMGE